MTKKKNPNVTLRPGAKTPKARLALDLSKTHAVWTHGWITCYLTWTQHNRRPALALLPTAMLRHGRVQEVIPCIVPLDRAWVWDETTGDGRECAVSAVLFARSLTFEAMPDPKRVFQITDVIRGHLGDLLTCPPMPEVEQVEVAFAKHTDPFTGKVHETGITEDV